jgi:hypothetical protein
MTTITIDDFPQALRTLGERFADGAAIERLHDQKLILFREGQEFIAPVVQHNNRCYVAAELDPSLEQALYFPIGTEDFGDTPTLVNKLQDAIGEYCDLGQENNFLLATFIIATWTSDQLPAVPIFNPWGPAGAGNILLDLLRCLCRRPLSLLDPTLQELSKLPRDLRPTLILHLPSTKLLTALITVSNQPHANVLRSGQLFTLQSPAVVYTSGPLDLPVISAPVLGREPKRRLLTSDRHALLTYFQPRLLAYRLRQHGQITNSTFDVPTLAPATRTLAQALGAAVAGAPELQKRITAALARFDEQSKAESFHSLPTTVLEVLLAACHNDARSLHVKEIARDTNVLLISRHEPQELTPKKVGSLLRKKLGISGDRGTNGYYTILLDNSQRYRIHRLSLEHGILSLSRLHDGCAVCRDMTRSGAGAFTTTPQQQTEEDVHKIHDVHDVHDVHNVHDVHRPISHEAAQAPPVNTVEIIQEEENRAGARS